MPQVVLNLPLEHGKFYSKHRDLFERISDGQVWKVEKREFSDSPETFRNSFGTWCRHRGWKAATSIAKPIGDVYVKVDRSIKE